MLIGDCSSEQEVSEKKDIQFAGILDRLVRNVKGWDSEKCPPAK